MDSQISEQDIGSGIFLLQRFKSTWTVTCWALTSFPSDLWLSSSTSFSFLTRKQKMVNFVLKIVIPASSVIKTSIANWFHVFWQFQILAIWWNIFHKIIRLLWNFRYRRIYLILKSLLTLNHFWDKGIKPDWIRVPKIYTWEETEKRYWFLYIEILIWFWIVKWNMVPSHLCSQRSNHA